MRLLTQQATFLLQVARLLFLTSCPELRVAPSQPGQPLLLLMALSIRWPHNLFLGPSGISKIPQLS